MLNFFYYCTHVTKDVHLSRRFQSSWVYSTPTKIKSSNSQARPNLLFSVPTKKSWGIQSSGVQDPACDIMRCFHWSVTSNSCPIVAQLPYSINNGTPSLMPKYAQPNWSYDLLKHSVESKSAFVSTSNSFRFSPQEVIPNFLLSDSPTHAKSVKNQPTSTLHIPKCLYAHVLFKITLSCQGFTMPSTQIVLVSKWFPSINLWYPLVGITASYHSFSRSDFWFTGLLWAPSSKVDHSPKANSMCWGLNLLLTLRFGVSFRGSGFSLTDYIIGSAYKPFQGLSVEDQSQITWIPHTIIEGRGSILPKPDTLWDFHDPPLNHWAQNIIHQGPSSEVQSTPMEELWVPITNH